MGPWGTRGREGSRSLRMLRAFWRHEEGKREKGVCYSQKRKKRTCEMAFLH